MIPINFQPAEKRQLSDGQYLDVHSIFFTIQGEGPFCGMPCVFVRLAGCNLQCPGCDTEYTQSRSDWSVAMIFSEVEYLYRMHTIPAHKKLVIITGGEPFRQNITPITALLEHEGYQVQIETNGTLPPPDNFPKNCVIVCSPKTPKINPQTAARVNAYKYVVSEGNVRAEDGLPYTALNNIAFPFVARPHAEYNGPVYIQPMDMKVPVLNHNNMKTARDCALKFGHILQLQIHKIIGVE